MSFPRSREVHVIMLARIVGIVAGGLAALAGTAGAQPYCDPPALFYSPANPVRGEQVSFVTDAQDATWFFGDGSSEEGQAVTHTYSSPGQYVVTVVGTSDCGPVSASRVLTVFNLICEVPGFTFSPGEPLRGQPITFSTAVAEAAWDFGDGGGASGPVVQHTYAAAGTYLVVVSGRTPCGPMTSPPRPIRVDDVVCEMPGFTMSPLRPVRGEAVTFSTALSPAWWDFGDGGAATGGVVTHVYDAPGSYDVRLTAQTPCGVLTADPRTIQVDDVACEVPSFTVTPENPLRGEPVTFSTRFTGARWEFGDGGRAEGRVVAHAYAAAGLYSVTLTANTACGPQTAPPRQLRVDDFVCEEPGFQFSPTAPLRGDTITFHTPLSEASWSFGDGATGAGSTVTHAYATAGTYGVTLTARTACGMMTARPRSVRVDDFACELPGFTYWPARPVPGEPITFSTPLAGATWTFGDGGTGEGQTVSHAYAATGTFSVGLTAETRCGRLTGHRTVEVFRLICETPDFRWTPADPIAGQDITFTTGAPNPTWSFGDGTRGAGPTVVHRYARAGRYSVSLTSQGPCGPLTSPTHIIDVEGLICELPTFTASATRAAIGQAVVFTTPWPGASWDFGDGGTAQGPQVAHAYAASGLYAVRLTADTPCRRLTSDPQTVAVGSAQAAYHCRVRLKDGYERPVANQRVFFGIYHLPGGPVSELVASTEARTAPDGTATLSLSGDNVDALYCWVEGHSIRDAGAMEETLIDYDGLPPGAAVVLDAVAVPLPRHREPFPGLRDGNASAALYQSGPYDKVLVIPEPFDAQENVTGKRRNEPKFWLQFKPALQALHQLGYDVWLVQPLSTGQNIHEQAAQFAQAVKFAVGYGPGARGGKAILFGYSMGGVVLRVATARWEADAQWRADLGLPAALPASLVMFGDAPLRGGQVNGVLQQFTWGKQKEHEANLDSCAAQQMLREVCYAHGGCNSNNWSIFFESPTPRWVAFPARQGTCDFVVEGLCFCEEAPGVFTINGDGWPHTVRKVAFSNGTWDPDYNVCYADHRDRNADGNTICPVAGSLYRPEVGHLLARMEVGPACPVSQDFPAAAGDLLAGSRHDTLYDMRLPANAPMVFNIFCDTVVFTQYFGGTFIPIRSALATDRPGVGPLDAVMNNTFQGTHGNFYGPIFAWAIGEFERAAAGSGGRGLGPAADIRIEPSEEDPHRIRFTGGTSHSPDGRPVAFEWRLADGTAETGPTIEHQFAVTGIYDVSLTVTDDSGARDTAVVRVRPGLPPNARPAADTGAPYRAVAGAPVRFDGSRSSDDNLIVRYDWDFGDGTQGSGGRPVHSYGQAGSYAVKLTVRDNDGEASTAESVLEVRVNSAPSVAIEVGGECVLGCQVTFRAVATDAEDDPIRFDWSGCGVGKSTSLTCGAARSGEVVASLVASDEHGAAAVAEASVPVFAAGYRFGAWGPCIAAGSFTCTASGPTGCQRPGSRTRLVEESAWTLDPKQAVPPPTPLPQACVQYAPGYVAAYTATYDASWTCTATGPQGCYKQRVGYAPSSYRSQAPDAAAPPARIYTTGYVSGWSTGDWGPCSASCGGGFMNRSVTPATFGPVGPDAPRPADTAECNTQPCLLSCGDMGWYWADQGELCRQECGRPCVKKQLCGGAPCQPWPHYCWKCD